MKIQINDCTIRDGGYLLDKNSPPEYIKGIVNGLVEAGIDIIEIGFLQDKVNNETLVYSNSKGARKYIPIGVKPSRFTGFCDNSRYSIENLDECDNKAFEYLRISFAKHESKEALVFVKQAKEKGYKVFANPMDAPSYSKEERSLMIDEINMIKPYAFSIVDTFGTMYLDDLRTIFTQFANELNQEIKIGLHSHNNLQLSNALAEVMIELAVESDRDIIVDGSLYGMGRGAGNASTEVLASYLNEKQNMNYNIGVLFDTIEKYIIPYQDTVKWGYDLKMFICGTKGSHVDNIKYLQKDRQCSSKEALDVISRLDISQRKRYGSNYDKNDFTELEKVCRENYVKEEI